MAYGEIVKLSSGPRRPVESQGSSEPFLIVEKNLWVLWFGVLGLIYIVFAPQALSKTQNPQSATSRTFRRSSTYTDPPPSPKPPVAKDP